jgi:DNA-binding CsgD family transcriptional regulator
MTPESRNPVFGRGAELHEITAFLDAAPADTTALRIEGEAGVGKTTLWAEAVRLGRDSGLRVLSASASEQETKLAFATLSDLLEDVLDEVADDLPPPQRKAISVALLRAESQGVRPDRRAVGLAVVETIRHLAKSTRVLVAVDDVQWVDASSAQALAFAVRRLSGVPVRVIATLRVGPGLRDLLELDRAVPDEDLRRLRLGPLDATALQRLLRRRWDAALSASLSRRLHEASGGNPFFALELARAVEREGLEPAAGEPLPLPDLARLLRSRILLLSDEARDLLLIVAAAGRPTMELVRRLASSPDVAEAALREAERHELIQTIADRVRFAHPLLGSTLYADAGLDRRRSVHLRLARAVDDPIEHAWHLALSAEGPDPEVASALDDAAEVAESRGAPAVAAELSELAQRLTPIQDTDAVRARAVASSERLFAAGDLDRAIARMEDIAADAPPGWERADVLLRLGRFQWNDIRRVRGILDRALREAGDASPPILRINLHRAMGWVELVGGDLQLAASHLDHASALAEATGNRVEIALNLVAEAYLGFFTGHPSAIDWIWRAVSMQDELRGLELIEPPRRTLGMLLMWSGELDAGRLELERDYRETVERGHLGTQWEVLVYLAELEVRAGNWHRAEQYAAEGLDVVTDTRQEQAREVHLWSNALVAAHRGQVSVARTHATEGLHLAEQHEDHFEVIANGSVLGFLELSLGNAPGAHEHMAPLLELAERMGIEEPGIFPFLPDEIEALVGLGRLDPAEALLERLEDLARARDRPLALAGASRCRGMLAAARADYDHAVEAVEEAVEHHGRVAQPFDLARTRLVQGQIQRRMKRKRPARATLEQALQTFEHLGARLWAQRARVELGRIGGRPPSPTGLTPTEQQVANLVGQGMTNRDVASALFMSEHTVRANLKRIYAKFGVRSRTELVARLRDNEGLAARTD